MPNNWKPKSELAKAVYAAGFKYDPDQDIIYSRMKAWQRKFGYAYIYDYAAPVSISAVIDCEPFFFRYNKKDWMIELWKGQYGLETGSEAGVYVSNQPLLDPILGKRPHDKENSKFFDCANNKELLMMSFTLKRKGEPLFSRGPEKHWWLTGFKWGILSEPEDLTMDLSITFPAADMRKAFVAALEKAKYRNISIDGDTVKFIFDKPTSFQPRIDDPECKKFAESARKDNSTIVKDYKKLGLKNNDPNQISGDKADEFIAYFKSFRPRQFRKHLKTYKKIFKENVSIIKAMQAGLINFFHNLFR